MAQNVDGDGKYAMPSTKMAQNMDGDGKYAMPSTKMQIFMDGREGRGKTLPAPGGRFFSKEELRCVAAVVDNNFFEYDARVQRPQDQVVPSSSAGIPMTVSTTRLATVG